MANPNIDAETLHRLLRYDAKTGTLYWRPRPRDMFVSDGSMRRWNHLYADKPALNYRGPKGYRIGKLLDRMIGAHRVVWAMIHGVWANKEIDHINGDGGDNRPENIRELSRAENLRNKRLYRNNRTGLNGITRKGRLWRARIRVNGKDISLGCFKTADEAKSAREEANKRYGYSDGHGGVRVNV